jgi:hypothetical protein
MSGENCSIVVIMELLQDWLDQILNSIGSKRNHELYCWWIIKVSLIITMA